MTVKVYAFHEKRAQEAFEAHAALLKAERENPRLSHNPQWTILRQDAYAAFAEAFAVLR